MKYVNAWISRVDWVGGGDIDGRVVDDIYIVAVSGSHSYQTHEFKYK